MSFKNKYLKYKSKYLQLQSDNTLAKIINEKYQLGGGTEGEDDDTVAVAGTSTVASAVAGTNSTSVNADNLIKFINQKKAINDRITKNKYFVMLYGPPRNDNNESPDLAINLGVLDIITYEQHFSNNDIQHIKKLDEKNIKSSFVDTRLTSKDIGLLNPSLIESINNLITKIKSSTDKNTTPTATLTTPEEPTKDDSTKKTDDIFRQISSYIKTSDMSAEVLDTNEKRKQIDMLINLLVTLGFYLNKNIYYELYTPTHFDYYIKLCKLFDYIPIIVYTNVKANFDHTGWEKRLKHPNNLIRFFSLKHDLLFIKNFTTKYDEFKKLNKNINNRNSELFCDNISFLEIDDINIYFIERYQRYKSNGKSYDTKIWNLGKETFDSKTITL